MTGTTPNLEIGMLGQVQLVGNDSSVQPFVQQKIGRLGQASPLCECARSGAKDLRFRAVMHVMLRLPLAVLSVVPEGSFQLVKQIGLETKEALERGDLRQFAALMHTHWEHKKARSANMSNSRIDECYELGRKNGALSGKLIGAGGGGFLMFYTEDKTRLRQAMTEVAGLRELRIRFDFEGTRLVAQS